MHSVLTPSGQLKIVALGTGRTDPRSFVYDNDLERNALMKGVLSLFHGKYVEGVDVISLDYTLRGLDSLSVAEKRLAEQACVAIYGDERLGSFFSHDRPRKLADEYRGRFAYLETPLKYSSILLAFDPQYTIFRSRRNTSKNKIYDETRKTRARRAV